MNRWRISGTVSEIGLLPRVVRLRWPVGGCIGGDGGQEGQGEHDKRDVPVPCGPVPHLVMVQADLAFGGLEAFFDAPASAGHADEFAQRLCGR